jgi:Leu/Phe-tRNA-protein transferase
VLDPDLLLRAYSIGVFPMSDSRDAADVFWVEPKRRAILPAGRLSPVAFAPQERFAPTRSGSVRDEAFHR